MTLLPRLALASAISLFAFGSVLADTPPASNYTPSSGQAGKDVVWVPTPQALVDRMLEMAELTDQDYLIDLGSGDGRTVITAAKRGARAHGIEYNPDMVALSQRAAKIEGVAERATFEKADIFESDFSKATIITLFLLPDLNVRLRPTLLKMKPGTRVLSNSFDMGDWLPDARAEAGGDCVSYCEALKWIIPAKVDGRWRLENGELRLDQTYQMLAGNLRRDGKTLAISDARMNGAEISFFVDGKRYTGTVDETGKKISGQIEGGGTWTASRA